MILGLAPMDGFTDCAMRAITQQVFEKYGEKKHQLMLRTEFMNADGYIINPTGVMKHLLTNKEQYPVIAQIFGSREDMLINCFQEIEKKYSKVFSGIELNMGCPARNVMQTGGGSALLKDRKQSLALIKKLRKATTLPFSIKTRIGINTEDREEQTDFLVKASTYCDMITIHGRTVNQGYMGDADRDFIYHLKTVIDPKCKIIGNGGITSYEDIQEKIGNLDGVMIGQGAVGNPRIFTPHTPSRKELLETILLHLRYTINAEIYFQQQKEGFNGILPMPSLKDLSGEILADNFHPMALAEFRKHLFQYIKGIPDSREFKVQVSQINEYKLLVQAIEDFFA